MPSPPERGRDPTAGRPPGAGAGTRTSRMPPLLLWDGAIGTRRAGPRRLGTAAPSQAREALVRRAPPGQLFLRLFQQNKQSIQSFPVQNL